MKAPEHTPKETQKFIASETVSMFIQCVMCPNTKLNSDLPKYQIGGGHNFYSYTGIEITVVLPSGAGKTVVLPRDWSFCHSGEARSRSEARGEAPEARSEGPEGLRPGPETCVAPERCGKTNSLVRKTTVFPAERAQNDRYLG